MAERITKLVRNKRYLVRGEEEMRFLAKAVKRNGKLVLEWLNSNGEHHPSIALTIETVIRYIYNSEEVLIQKLIGKDAIIKHPTTHSEIDSGTITEIFWSKTGSLMVVYRSQKDRSEYIVERSYVVLLEGNLV